MHLISAEQDDVEEAYKAIRNELESFGRGLAEKHELVVLSKSDMLEPEELKSKLSKLEAVVGKGEVATVSILDDEAVKVFSDRLTRLLESESQL